MLILPKIANKQRILKEFISNFSKNAQIQKNNSENKF